jgi:hypothetical protein
METRPRAIVTGMIATYPVGGVAWDYGQYALGLEELGFEVFYLEDTGGPTYDPTKREYGDNCQYGIQFLQDSLHELSPLLADRWHFRSAADDCYGIEFNRIKHIIADADLFLNVSGSALLRDEYMRCQCKVLIDTDPGWNHFVNYPRWDSQPGWKNTHGFRGHDHFFTYAERIGKPDCLLPNLGVCWHPTRPPIALDRWAMADPGRSWTTVMTWNNFHRPVEYAGRVYGTKEMEFEKIESIPASLRSVEFEIATGGSDPPIESWKESGWRVRDSHSISATMDDYRNYIQGSRGELSVAKNLYVATRCGWFSCRSACYLAAGRPVVIQDTGFSDTMPTGKGLFAFSDEKQAVAAIETIEGDYALHASGARELASEYLSARNVLGNLLETVGFN